MPKDVAHAAVNLADGEPQPGRDPSLPLQMIGPKSSIDPAADAGDDVWQSLDIFQRCAEINDTGSKEIRITDKSVGHESFSTVLQLGQEFLVQSIQILFGFGRAYGEVRWNVAESCDAQVLGKCFQLWVELDEPVQVLG